jgi:hypothetical protein
MCLASILVLLSKGIRQGTNGDGSSKVLTLRIYVSQSRTIRAFARLIATRLRLAAHSREGREKGDMFERA